MLIVISQNLATSANWTESLPMSIGTKYKHVIVRQISVGGNFTTTDTNVYTIFSNLVEVNSLGCFSAYDKAVNISPQSKLKLREPVMTNQIQFIIQIDGANQATVTNRKLVLALEFVE